MVKEIKLPMKFNAGLKKYEPELPVKKLSKKIDFNWIKFILILLSIIAFGAILYFLYQILRFKA